jgi:hypothetical protein
VGFDDCLVGMFRQKRSAKVRNHWKYCNGSGIGPLGHVR